MAFNVLKYSDVEAQKLDIYQVDGVPTDLFGKSFVKIKSITMNESITDVVNAKIRYIITKGLVTYYTLFLSIQGIGIGFAFLTVYSNRCFSI